MSEPNPHTVKSSSLIKTLTGTALVSGILIVSSFQLTFDTIKKNKARVLRQAIFEVLPGAEKIVPFKVEPTGELSEMTGDDEKAKKVFVGYDNAGKLLGVAVETYTQGFQDIIRILYGYSPAKQEIIGFKVLESKETPGLGDKIEKDPQYLSNFKNLDVKLNGDGKTLVHEIEVVKKGKKVSPWQMDTITGATISSKAVGRMIKASSANDIPVIYQNLSKLEKK